MDSAYSLPPAASVSVLDVAKIAWRRKWIFLTIIAASLGTAAYINRKTPPRWRATAQMILVQRAAPLVVSPQAGYAAPVVETPETQLAMLQSTEMARRTIDLMKNDALQKGKLTDSIDSRIESVQQQINALVPKDTNLMTVTAEGGSRDSASELANAVCRAFVAWKKEVMQQGTQDAMNTLETRAGRAKSQMLAAEQAETAFKQQHRIADVPAQQAALISEYNTRNGEVVALKQDLAGEQARLGDLANRLRLVNKNVDSAIKNGTGVRDDAELTAMQTQLRQLEMDRFAAAQKYTDKYLDILPNLDAQITETKTRLAKAERATLDNKRPSMPAQAALFEQYKAAQTEILFTRAKFEGAVGYRDRLQAQIKGIPQVSMEYARLARNADIARTLSNSLQSALNAAHLDKDLSGGNVQIAQQAFVPEKPFTPNKVRDLAFGGAVGLFLSLASVLLLEQADRRIRTVDDVRRLVGGPIVGTLPQMGRAQRHSLEIGETPALAAEAYSLARANLSLAIRQAGTGDHKVLLVTSALPGEGKSLTAAHLSRSLARAGRSVILVDADMRRPTQGRLFNAKESFGLADVLAGKKTLDETLVGSDTPNLTILHSGSPDRNPTELVSLPQMESTLDALRREADVVIVDAPACSVVADALFLAPHVDSILNIIGAGLVDEETVRDTTSALQAAAPKSMVYFVNRAPKSRSHAYKNYYRYDALPASAASLEAKSQDINHAVVADLPRLSASHPDDRSDKIS